MNDRVEPHSTASDATDDGSEAAAAAPALVRFRFDPYYEAAFCASLDDTLGLCCPL